MLILSRADGHPARLGNQLPRKLVLSLGEQPMASQHHLEIIYSWLVPSSRPQRPKRKQLAIKEIHGKG